MQKYLAALSLSLALSLSSAAYGQSSSYAQQHKATVTVDFAAQELGIHSVSGFLHGASSKNMMQPPDKMVAPLRPKLWRGTPDMYERAVRAGGRLEVIVSDTWGYPFQKDNTNRSPYENYTKWENHVRKLARENKDKPILWDIWNEPNGGEPAFWKGSREQLFETYGRAYRVLREELGPNVLIGGPSTAEYDRDYIVAFLEYCKAHNLEVNFLSWHELVGADKNPSIIADHLIDARKNFVNNPVYKSLNIKEIHINESVGYLTQYQPGDIVSYLYYLEKGRADAASKACWPDSQSSANCFNNTLDGLLTPKSFEPRAAWWVYKIYADGVDSRVKSESTDPRVVALASNARGSQKAQVLIGYSNYQGSPTSKSITLKLQNLQALGLKGNKNKVYLELHRLSDSQEKTVKSMVVAKREKLTISNGQAQASIPSFGVHEAYFLTISK
jgi:xylan 1,4-beta-xylosidase